MLTVWMIKLQNEFMIEYSLNDKIAEWICERVHLE